VRYTQTFVPTVREVPSDAVTASHMLMIRAGMIRQLAAGVYTYLPMGYRALRKAEQIVRDQMDRAGAVELHMPVLIPVDLFRKTGRDEAYGELVFRFTDRQHSQFFLGPTHEEVVTQIVADHVNSYKQLPVNLYQIQTKFRDEERPKSGILRTREFLMKDAYSFHTSLEDLNTTYQQMYDAYVRLFKQCGLPAVIAEAESGPIGGHASHEFMVLTDVGEDQVVLCEGCGYAANIERSARQAPNVDVPIPDDRIVLKEVHTPGMSTITRISEFLNCRPDQLIKTLIYRAGDDVLVALVRGDHEVNESKLCEACGTSAVELADEQTIRELTGAEVGFAGPVGLSASRMIIDYDVLTITDGVTGGNKTDYHLTGVVAGRDFKVSTEMLADIRNVVAGDKCPACGGELALHRAIEVGHVFKLGTKYSAAMGARYTDAAGKLHDMIMGCYGIGINRIIAAAVETYHDQVGIIWPISIAPYEVEIIALNMADQQVRSRAEALHDELERSGIDVLLDDRDARGGVKLRRESDVRTVPADQAARFVKDLVAKLHRELGDR